jgi:biotin transport system substrate-specific component
LATFAVFCAGALLGSKFGALSLALWAAIGAVGVPVFTMFRSGFGALLGPTGGYIVGYIPAAFVIGFIIENVNIDTKKKVFLYPAAMVVGMLIYFVLGTAWFMYSTNTGLWEALMICVIPFLPGEFIKAACATAVAIRIRPIIFAKA